MQEQKRGKKKKTHSASKFTVGNGIFFKSKTSQITLFVIIGIVLLASIIIAFFALRDKILPETNISLDVRQKMEKCIKDSANEAILEISSHGGYSNDTIISKENILFEETKIPLLCSTSGYGELCTNNEPMLIQNSEKEIKSIITTRIEKCFSNLETQFKKSYSYNAEQTFIEVKILPSYVDLIVQKKITIQKGNQTENFDDFSEKINSGLYDSIILTNEIINEELKCNCEEESCNAEIISLNKNNHNFEITKPVFSNNNEEVYVIKEISTDNKFQFAVRNCVRSVPGI
jgi:Na+-transporting NADH:ubiquinone oxidoreductase subunit NqrC